ncbi:MAG: penicillin-binding transpeptidase domain-containing protein, partial [Myxococcaceae bacterium]
MMYAAIGNGGNLYTPQLVRRVESSEGKVLEEFQPKLVRHLNITPEQRQVIVDGLVAVVNEAGGTAYGRRLKDIVVAGKTGTAQVVKLGQVRVKAANLDYWERDNAWFASFAPAADPEIAVVVLNEHGGFGAAGAAPAAMEIIQKYFDMKGEEATAARVPVQPIELHLPPHPEPPGKKSDDKAAEAQAANATGKSNQVQTSLLKVPAQEQTPVAQVRPDDPPVPGHDE